MEREVRTGRTGRRGKDRTGQDGEVRTGQDRRWRAGKCVGDQCVSAGLT